MALTRREVLLTSVAAGTGAVGLAAVGALALQGNTSDSAETAAHLRGATPLPFAQLHALDLTASGQERANVLRAAHHAIAAIDGGDIAAWLALGEGALPSPADRPRHLKKMPSFAGDVLDPAQSHGDLLLHITGSSARAVRQAAEQALRALPQQQVRWRVDGTRPENRTEDGRGLSRNPFHFTEGHGNPGTAAEITERATIKAGQGEPSWAVGASYQVIRIIRLATDFWDRDTVHEQERIIGRRKNGRWLDGTPSTERAVFATDPHGKTTPLDAHVRRAVPNPRTPPPMVRRSYNYHRAPDDQGLIFSCFQSDLEKGFEAVQRRLQGEAMAKYTLTTGGGYFFVPPPGEAWLSALDAN
ncbi:Dyp-type peroxidase [Streptomyces iakyrus]|uniref:Dyp-type peroxidase n=1 Tax=Streptomyces iakyrus TaxID=68219 RepID=UPI001FD725EA|nr:Dyp-type peroxidase [Streptomyces iakyrus]